MVPKFSAALLLADLAMAGVINQAVSVDCKAPWVVIATDIMNLLPSSQGPRMCSSILSKYQTTTETITSTTGTTTQTQYQSLAFTAPTPSVTTTLTTTNTLYVTSDVTVPYTITTIDSEVVTATSYDVETTTITVASPNKARAVGDARMKRNVQSSLVADCAKLAGIATSLVNGFCSCEAPGPTSTATLTSTVFVPATATSTITTYTATITPIPATIVVTNLETVTLVVETDTFTSTTIDILTDFSTTIDVETVVITATATALPTFYIQVQSTDSTNGQCAYWEPYEGNTLSFAGSSGNVNTKQPIPWTLDQTTGWLSGGGLVAGSENYHCDEEFDCEDVIFVRGAAASSYTDGSNNYSPLTCSYDGTDGGALICSLNMTSPYSQTPFTETYFNPGLQTQYFGAGNSVNNQEVLFYQDQGYNNFGVSLRALWNLNECAGYTS